LADDHSRNTQLQRIESRKKLLLILVAGLAMRLALLWMPGTEDMHYFRMWGALALRAGLLRVYTWNDQDTLDAVFLKLHGIELHPRTTIPTDLGPVAGIPDYPPGNILFLELSAGLCKFLQGGVLRAGYLLNACLNLWPLLFSLATTLALWMLALHEGSSRAVAAVAAFWLNPALILTSPVLGYQDPIFAFFGLLALVSFHRKKCALSALFLALSCLTKPQGVFIIPVLAAACWAEGTWRMLWQYSSRFLLFLLVPLLPYIAAGRILTPAAAIFRGAIFPALSAQTTNFWWLVGGMTRAISSRSFAPLLREVQMVPQYEFAEGAGLNPLWLSLAALGAFTGMNMYFLVRQFRAGNRAALFWSAALQVYGYTMMALFVHENHLFAFCVYAAPLLAVNGRRIVRLYWAVSAIFGLNLLLFDGIGQGLSDWLPALRNFPGFDLSIALALANLVIFIFLLRLPQWAYDTAAASSPPPSLQ
jgi:hypothetical protein